MKKLFFIFIIFLFLFSCSHQSYVVFESGKQVSVELAETSEQQSNGLMFRTSLDENSGMLFIFKEQAERTFWMKNTLIPLDIIFINKDLEIVNIFDAIPCEKEPCALYSSQGKYVLEVNQNFSIKNKIKIGQKVRLKL